MSEEKKGFFRRLREGLTKTRNNIVAGIDSIFSGFSSIDDDFYEEIEEILVMGDIGINTTTSIIEHLKEEVEEKKIKEPSECKQLLIDEIKRTYPGCIALKNDAGYIQGFPDWTILYKDKWVALEIKRDEGANRQPNQEYYISKLDDMSYAAFVYPENKDKVLQELSVIFGR